MGVPTPARGVHWKGVLFINVKSDRPTGWSETYHLIASSYAEALSALDTVWEARRPCLAGDCILDYGYVSDEGIAGDSLVYFPLAGHLLGTYPGSTVHTLAPWNVLLCRLQSGAAYRIMRPVRGIPSTEDLSTFAPAPGAYLSAVTDYLAVLKSNTYARIQVKGFDLEGTGNYRRISDQFALRWSERRDGRPFGLRRGRSPSRVG